MTRAFLLSALAALSLAACQTTAGPGTVSRLNPPPATGDPDAAPPGAPPGTCWTRQIMPATVETITRHKLVSPAETAPDGRILTPARYRTEKHQRIVEERRAIRFQTPCRAQLDHEFIASMQRALAVRGFYRGAITGRYDAPTRHSVLRFQTEQGLESGILSLKTARQLGLASYPPPPADG